jgi:hypothetical protein
LHLKEYIYIEFSVLIVIKFWDFSILCDGVAVISTLMSPFMQFEKIVGVSDVTTDSRYVDSVYKKAVEIGVATWVGALQKLRGRVLQPDFICNASVPASSWGGGRELYKYVT